MPSNKQLFKDALGWGIALWLLGYLLGFILFAFVPQSQIGWFIMPIGVASSLWVLLKKIKGNYLKVAITWTAIAIVFDYLFLVKLLKPVDGYYKLDIYLYYTLTFVLPIVVGKLKSTKAA